MRTCGAIGAHDRASNGLAPDRCAMAAAGYRRRSASRRQRACQTGGACDPRRAILARAAIMKRLRPSLLCGEPRIGRVTNCRWSSRRQSHCINPAGSSMRGSKKSAHEPRSGRQARIGCRNEPVRLPQGRSSRARACRRPSRHWREGQRGEDEPAHCGSQSAPGARSAARTRSSCCRACSTLPG